MTSCNPIEDTIHIVKYNPKWPELAKKEILRLHKLFLNKDWVVDIQHIGSTSIPNLAAKPIIDIYLGVTSLEEAQDAILPIKKMGYQFWEENPNKEKMFFVKGMPPFGQGRTHHIHIVRYDSCYWQARILFRDYLRAHPEEIPVYAKLKYNLMQEHPIDREAYTDAKTIYITHVLRKAGFQEEVQR